MAGVADEPGVAEILARAGLAGGRPTRKLRLLRGAGDERLAHHRVHHRHVARLDDAPERLRRARVDNLACTRAHALDHVRRDRVTAVGEWRIGAGEFERRDFRGAERERRIGVELGRNSEPIGGLGHGGRPDLEREAHRHGVE